MVPYFSEMPNRTKQCVGAGGLRRPRGVVTELSSMDGHRL